ncbi:hypothetical protein ACQP2Y_08500 [Actinoplanes sp. CA-051413]|uniref:hypothetical protein n=1 Tax=Actinoplanes sp. CA-051413 TaxID=3239899 RepID=UPI003D997EE3
MEQFEDAWNSLGEAERSLLLDARDSRPVPPAVADILVRVALAVEPQPGLFPAPVHWPIGFRDFLDDKAALIDLPDDPECE